MEQTAKDLELVEWGSFREPELVVRDAQRVAAVFQSKMEIIKDVNGDPILFRLFPGGNGKTSRHITRPGWQLLGSMFRVTAGIVEGSLQHMVWGDFDGFQCTAEAIYVPTKARISTAVGMCANDEPNWDLRAVKGVDRPVPMFQLASMAQTRACSKVLSNLLAYVAIMAGCSGTPAEELTGSEGKLNGNGQTSSPAPQRTQSGGSTINDAQVNRLFAVNKQAGRSRDGLGVILAALGYAAPSNAADPVEDAARLVLKSDFDRVQTEVMKPVQR